MYRILYQSLNYKTTLKSNYLEIKEVKKPL